MRALTAAALLALATPAAAEELTEGRWTWTTRDTAAESLALGLLAVDWMQTSTTARHPVRFRETNSLLGRHPSPAQVNAYFAAAMLAHVAVSRALPRPYRRWFQAATIVVEAGTVYENATYAGVWLTVPWSP